ncbi:MAG: extracellular solute-binding protein [Lachnospiraceae bacterium]|nr:extracellular solute-binding protein [Lachnospiraceae bacterium]
MKKKVLSVLLAATMVLSLAACGEKAPSTSTSTPDSTEASVSTEAPASTDVAAPEAPAEVEGMKDGKFVETRHISVEVYDRDGATPANDNVWTDWIKAQMLEKYNVEVEFVAVPRWTEVDQINNLLAAGTAPDICYTYDYPTIQTYATMGGVQDLAPVISQYKDMLPNLFGWLGEENIYMDLDPVEGTLWCVEGRRNNIYRINTFVRADWLEKLGIAEPTTRAEFEAMLVAFRDNAETLLGADADKMVPFSVSYDIGWRAANLIESFMDPAISDKDYYVNGYDDRKFTEPGTKEAVRVLNGWYNDGLIWKDFALYASGDTSEDDMIKAGYVGAFMHNYDYPFRNGADSINAVLGATYGEGAKFVAVDCFEDKNGNYTKYSYSPAGDRKAFFPTTNDEPLASMLYLDFISTQSTVEYLQKGEEGINHKVLDGGAIAIQAVDEANVAYTQNSGNNIDLTMTTNGLRLATDELTNASLAYTYANVDPADVVKAMTVAFRDHKVPISVSVGEISAETGVSNLTDKRDATFDNAVIAAPADFDSVWDAGMAEYLSAGGQDIMDERLAKWIAVYGDALMLP